MSLIHGPFRALEGQWQSLALHAGLPRAVVTEVVESFAQRAEELYGPS